MVEYGHKIEEKVKGMQTEIKENVQGTNSDRKETGTQIKGLDQKEEINIQSEENEKIIIQKKNNKDMLRKLWDNFKRSNIWVIWVPEGEQEEQEIENSFEKNNE